MVIKGMMICNESRIRFKNIQVHEEPRAQLQINFFTTSVETSVVAFRKQLKETALRVSQKKKKKKKKGRAPPQHFFKIKNQKQKKK